MKTIAQQLNIKEFPFQIRDKNGKELYWEDQDGFWKRYEYNSNGWCIYWETSNGLFADNRPKYCEGKLVEVDGIKYKLVKA